MPAILPCLQYWLTSQLDSLQCCWIRGYFSGSQLPLESFVCNCMHFHVFSHQEEDFIWHFDNAIFPRISRGGFVQVLPIYVLTRLLKITGISILVSKPVSRWHLSWLGFIAPSARIFMLPTNCGKGSSACSIAVNLYFKNKAWPKRNWTLCLPHFQLNANWQLNANCSPCSKTSLLYYDTIFLSSVILCFKLFCYMVCCYANVGSTNVEQWFNLKCLVKQRRNFTTGFNILKRFMAKMWCRRL